MNSVLIANAAAAIIGDDTLWTTGVVLSIISVALVVGESRWQVAHLREWKREAEVKIAKLELAQGRTEERLDSMHALLTEVRGMVLQLLQQQK